MDQLIYSLVTAKAKMYCST